MMRTSLLPALWVLLVIRVAGAGLAPDQAVTLFNQANEAYLSAEKLSEEGSQVGAIAQYDTARELYEQLHETGRAGASLYYNLGNAYARLGRWGGAIWSYRRALRLAPRDADFIANLSYVRDKAVDAIPTRELSFARSLLAWHFGLSLDETWLVTVIVYYLLSIVLSFWFFVKPPVLRKAAYVLGILLIAFAASGTIKFLDERSPREAVIVAKSVNVLSGPSDSGQPRFRLHSGAEVKLEETSDGWVRIFIDRERRGWVRSSACRIL